MPHGAALRLRPGDHDHGSCRTVRHPNDHAALPEATMRPTAAVRSRSWELAESLAKQIDRLVLRSDYRGSPVPVTRWAVAPQLTELHGLGAVARKREPL